MRRARWPRALLTAVLAAAVALVAGTAKLWPRGHPTIAPAGVPAPTATQPAPDPESGGGDNQTGHPHQEFDGRPVGVDARGPSSRSRVAAQAGRDENAAVSTWKVTGWAVLGQEGATWNRQPALLE